MRIKNKDGFKRETEKTDVTKGKMNKKNRINEKRNEEKIQGSREAHRKIKRVRRKDGQDDMKVKTDIQQRDQKTEKRKSLMG